MYRNVIGLALEVEGVVITGAGCEDGCGAVQRINPRVTPLLRGQAFARTIGKVELKSPLWEHWFPASKEASEALTLARDKYNRLFVDGYLTAGGMPHAWLLQINL